MPRFVSTGRRSITAALLTIGAGLAVQACGDPSDPKAMGTTATTSSTPPPVTSTSTGTTPTTPAPTAPSVSTSNDSSTTITPPAGPSAPDTSSAGLPSSEADSSGGAGVPTLDEIRDILLFRCGNLICHMPPPYTPPNFALSGDELYTLLTTFTVDNCAGSPLITPGETENSAILKVVSGGCGEFFMPPVTYDNFSAEELATITAWVEAGAPK